MINTSYIWEYKIYNHSFFQLLRLMVGSHQMRSTRSGLLAGFFCLSSITWTCAVDAIEANSTCSQQMLCSFWVICIVCYQFTSMSTFALTFFVIYSCEYLILHLLWTQHKAVYTCLDTLLLTLGVLMSFLHFRSGLFVAAFIVPNGIQ